MMAPMRDAMMPRCGDKKHDTAPTGSVRRVRRRDFLRFSVLAPPAAVAAGVAKAGETVVGAAALAA